MLRKQLAINEDENGVQTAVYIEHDENGKQITKETKQLPISDESDLRSHFDSINEIEMATTDDSDADLDEQDAIDERWDDKTKVNADFLPESFPCIGGLKEKGILTYQDLQQLNGDYNQLGFGDTNAAQITIAMRAAGKEKK